MPANTPRGRGLTPTIVVASVLLALLIASTFVYLLASVRAEAESSRRARHIRTEMATADALELRFVELDRDVRGAALTGDTSFLASWDQDRESFLRGMDQLEQFVGDPTMAGRVGQIADASRRYLDESLQPLVASSEAGTPARGLDQLLRPTSVDPDTVLSMFNDYQATEARLLEARLQSSNDATGRAVIAATVGVAGSIVLVAGFSGYLVRYVLRPLRRASTMADRLAGGDLTVRLGEDGPGEIGQLERSFNTMGNALELGRDSLVAVVAEQAALHRVASLVATGAPTADVFAAVVAEVEPIMASDATVLLRFDGSCTATMVASQQRVEGGRPVGSSWSFEGDELVQGFTTVEGTPHAGSIATAAGPTADMLRDRGMRSMVGAPITVEGRIWGAIIVVWLQDVDDPTAAGHQVGEFTELVGTAVANAHSRDQLAASRARIVVAADEARRRIERDIHDGAQQRLISLGLELRLAQMSVTDDPELTKQELQRLGDSLTEAVESLQELARGIHPAILSHGGLAPALEGLARRSPVPATVRTTAERRVGESVEVAAYYVVSEALTNVAKHAVATSVTIDLDIDDELLRIVVSDDGVGGADAGAGSGLVGLRDRIEAVGGHLGVESRPGEGTTLHVTMPAAPPPVSS